MYLPSVQPINHQEMYINGDVQIDPQAILAPGVILQAVPGSRIIIKAGACLGMGTVLNAYQGLIEIGTGVVLGAGVLIMGTCNIGSHSCVGTSSTIINTSIEAKSIIPPGSLIGDQSRQIVDVPLIESEPEIRETVAEPPEPSILEENVDQQEQIEEDVILAPEEQQMSSPTKEAPVIGEVYINQLLLTLFPEAKNLRKPK